MDVRIEQVSMGDDLPVTSLAFGSGEATRFVVETEQRLTVLGLIAAGRMRPTAGRVLVDDEPTSIRRVADRLRRSVALVDAPLVSDPEPAVTLAGVLAEELLYAGVPGDARSVRGWAEQLGVVDALSVQIANVDPAIRIRVLVEVALLRDDVEAIVLASPDRHGGQPEAWWDLARKVADRGFAVLVLCGAAADDVLHTEERGDHAREIDEATTPLEGAFE